MNLRRSVPLLAACCAVLFAAGCVPVWPEPPRSGPQQVPPAVHPDPAEARLADAAVRAEAALSALARIEAAQATPPNAERPGSSSLPGSSPVPAEVPPELRRPVTLDWIGPLEALAETLSRYAGYRFVVAGAPPVRPVMAAVTAEETPLIEVLRDIGLQTGSAATLVVNANDRTVRLDWSADRTGAGEHPDKAPGKEGA